MPFWAVTHCTVLPWAQEETEVQQAEAAEGPGERYLLVFSAVSPARQMGGCVMSLVSAAPLPESLLCSPVEWRWGRRAHHSISKVSDLYGSCSPVCRSECPCPMFNSWQTHAFSVTVAFMASHTILLVQPQPYKDIKKFLWCSYLSQSGRVTTSAPWHDDTCISMITMTWRASFYNSWTILKDRSVICRYIIAAINNHKTCLRYVSSWKWKKDQKHFLELFDIWDLSINPQQHTGRV